MTLTHNELQERVASEYDPDLLVDILGISSEELIEAFGDKVEEKRFMFEKEFEDDDERSE